MMEINSSFNFQPKNPDFLEAVEEIKSRQNFMKHIGFELTRIEAGYAEGKVEFKEFLRQQAGFLHGGAIATFSDLVCGFAACTLIEEKQALVTSDLKISFLNPGLDEFIIAKGWVIKSGNLMSSSNTIICPQPSSSHSATQCLTRA